MSMKKKLTVTTLAASMMLASTAVVPLSTTGALSKFGLTSSVAAASAFDQLNAFKVELSRDAEGASKVAAARAFAQDNLSSIITDKKELIKDIFDKVNDVTAVSADDLFDLVNALDMFYDGSSDALNALINDPDKRVIVNNLFVAAHLPGLDEPNGLKKQDVIDFQNAVLAALNDTHNKEVLAGQLGLALIGGTVDQQVIKDAVSGVIDDSVLSNDSLLLSRFLNFYSISLHDLDVAQSAIAAYINANSDVDAVGARNALLSAAVRYVLKNDIVYTGATSATTSVTPALTVFNVAIPNTYLTWSAGPDSNITYNGTSFVLKGTATSGSSVIQAKDARFGLLLYISPSAVSVTRQESPSNPGGGGGGAPTQSEADKAIAALDDLVKDLKNASEEKKQELLKAAEQQVNDAIAKLSTIDFSASIKVENGVAVPQINESALLDQLKNMTKQAQALNDKLKALNPNAAEVKVVPVLDFGSITAKEVNIPLAKSLFAAAAQGGIDKVAVKMNNLTIGVSPSEFSENTTLSVTKQDNSVATTATDLPVVSDVYSFEFATGGNVKASFSKPVTLEIPIASTSGIDSELLVLAKIVDGQLEFYGGNYNAATKKFEGERKSFSTYTVVENKVAFSDLDSVKSWAGRQIQVAAAKGVISGRAEGVYDPNGFVSRAEFAKLIVKTFHLEDAQATESFEDVGASDWFQPYVAAAVKAGIVNGKSAAAFDPNGQITRAEMAVMSSRALALKGATLSISKVDEVLKGFNDADAINASLKNGVAMAVSQGVLIGEEGKLFNPNANSTRAQAAVVIYRLLNK